MYIVFHGGCPGITPELPSFKPNRLGVMGEFWKYTKAYSHDQRWIPKVEKPPQYTWAQKILAHTVFNPREILNVTWETGEAFTLKDIIGDLEAGLAEDDDIIQQWFGADEVMKLASHAKNFEEMLLAFRCIEGAHEVDDSAKRYVEEALGMTR